MLMLHMVLLGCNGTASIQQRVTKTWPMLSAQSSEVVSPVTMLGYIEKMHDFTSACAALEGLLPHAYAQSEAATGVQSSRAKLHLWVGLCEVRRAWDYELQALKAIRLGHQSDALDAEILRQRSLARATTLFWQGFRADEASVFTREQLCGQLAEVGQQSAMAQAQLARIINGFMATYYDHLLSAAVGVPGRAAREVSQLSQCLADDNWWHVPSAVRAAVKGFGQAANRRASSQSLRAASQAGLESGVRLAAALEAMLLEYWGESSGLGERLADFFAQGRYTENPSRRLLDEWAVLQMQQVSDRHWMAATGARTPPSLLGQLPPKTEQAFSGRGVNSARQEGRTESESVGPVRPALKLEDAL